MFRTPKQTALISIDALAPTHSCVNLSSDPIEDGIDPLNWFLESALECLQNMDPENVVSDYEQYSRETCSMTANIAAEV